MEKITSFRHSAMLTLEAANKKHYFFGDLFISQGENRKFSYLFVGDFKSNTRTGLQTDVAQIRRGGNFRDEDDAMQAAFDAGLSVVSAMPEPMNA